MALKKFSLKTTEAHRGQRLDHALASWLPQALGQPVSKAKVRKLIVAGAVYLNGKRVRIASKELLPNARVDAFVDLSRLASDGPSKDVKFELSPERVLLEDEYLIVVDKPPGLPTQATLDQARDHLFAAVKRYLARRDRVTDPYVGLHHRLDRDTSGVVLFTKKTEANRGISESFAGHRAVKVYQAIAKRPQGRLPEARWTVKNYLGRAPGAKKAARFTAVRSGGDYAETEFKLIEAMPRAIWVEARPKTGRTHQIRVHLAEQGMPILGDATYGVGETSSGPGAVAPRLMLHAVSLTFEHPILKTEVTVQSPVPEDFRLCLQKLRS